MIELITDEKNTGLPKIKVIGIGGCGNNAINRLTRQSSYPIEYIAINTDQMVLNKSTADKCLAIGKKITNGFGAGGDPEIAKAAAEESEEELAALTSDANMIILTAGMGGGTGTGALPFMAKLCKNAGILTVAIVTTPFRFENPSRMATAAAGLHELEDSIDTLLVISNDRLLSSKDKSITMFSAFTLADSILKNTIDTVTNIIYNCGTVNLDFNDLKSILSNKGYGHLGIGYSDENKSLTDAVKEAVNSPLLSTNLQGAKYLMINFSGDINLMEATNAMQYIQEIVGEDAKILMGTVSPEDKQDDINSSVITIIATGINPKNAADSPCPKEQKPILTKSLQPIKLYSGSLPKTTIPAKHSELVIPEFLQTKRQK